MMTTTMDEHENADLGDYEADDLIESVRAGGISRLAFRDAMTAKGLGDVASRVLAEVE